MADTIADVVLTGAAYQDMYAATGISVGDELIIQNKTSGIIYIQVSVAQPGSSSVDGYLVRPVDPPVIIGLGASGCWVTGRGPVNVQENT